jgi:hypothetical protein
VEGRAEETRRVSAISFLVTAEPELFHPSFWRQSGRAQESPPAIQQERRAGQPTWAWKPAPERISVTRSSEDSVVTVNPLP